MIKKIAIVVFIVLGSAVMGMSLINTANAPATIDNKELTFSRGEIIEYKAHYGFLNAAVAKMIISDTVFQINDKKCFKIDIYGKSVGMFDFMMSINDNWGTYLDTVNVLPQRFWRVLREGKYRKHEIVDFNQKEHKAEVTTYNFKENRWRERQVFDIPVSCQDMVSGYYYLRTLDLTKYKKGDVITIDGFFDNEVYNFKIRYLGKDKLKTKIGTYDTHFFSPIMPKNGLFDGENSIKFWLSADKYKIPLKIKAEMFVGAVELDITHYQPSAR